MSDQFTEQTEPLEVVAYGLGGEVVEDPDSFEALAKRVFDPNSGSTKFYVKRSSYGIDAGSMYNPVSPMFDMEAAKGYRGDLGKHKYEYRRVHEEAFDLYLRFLVTQNPAYVRQAERYV